MYKDLTIVPNTYVGVCTIFLHCILILPLHFQRYLILEKYEHPKFWENKSPNFGTPTWESRGKVIFRCSPYIYVVTYTYVEKHKVYYREGSGASSQRLRAV